MRFASIIIAVSVWSLAAIGVEPFNLPWKNHPVPGTEYHSSDHPEGIFVIHHWIYGCGWCHTLEPEVIQLAKDYFNEERVQVLDVGLPASQQDFDKWIAKHLPPYPVLEDKGRVLARVLGIKAVSTTSIVDCKGVIRYQREGLWEGDVKQQIRDKVDELLEESCDK